MTKVKEWFDRSLEELQYSGPPPEPAYKKVTLRIPLTVCDKLDVVAQRLGTGTRTGTGEELILAAIDEAYELVTSNEWLMSTNIESLPMDQIEQLLHETECDPLTYSNEERP